jgi:hypothetical protein
MVWWWHHRRSLSYKVDNHFTMMMIMIVHGVRATHRLEWGLEWGTKYWYGYGTGT